MRRTPRRRRTAQERTLAYFDGKNVLITGAAGGLGTALTALLAPRDVNLILLDHDTEALNDLVMACRSRRLDPSTVQPFVVDVSDSRSVEACEAEVGSHVSHIDVLINNAGILAAGGIDQFETNDYHAVMATNFFGVVHVTKCFLPLIQRSTAGHIVNISSAFGLISAPKYSAYSASKFAVRAFSEALHGELLSSSTKVHSVMPGGIQTGIARSARIGAGVDRQSIIDGFEQRVARTAPVDAALQILRGISRGRPRILVGVDAKLADTLARFTGQGYVTVLARRLG